MTSRGQRTTINSEALSLMGIPVMYQGATWKDYAFPNEKLEKVLIGYTTYCDAMFDDCINLLFYGGNGVGKTFITSIILQYCFLNRYSCQMVTFKDLVSKTFKGEDVSRYNEVEFLAIDELGAEINLKSDAEKSILEDLLKQRFAHGLPTIICSNLDLEQLKARYGNTLFSMLSEFIKAKILGADGRRDSFRKKKALQFLR